MAKVYLHKVASIASELDAAKGLKKALESELAEVEGQVWLIPSIDIHPATGRHDIDLIMMGYLHDFFIDEIAGFQNIEIKSFISTIEIKSHDATGIFRDGTHIKVVYDGKDSDVTKQSDEQKLSLRRFLHETLNDKGIRVPFIANLIWLVGIDKDDYDQTIGISNSNILVSGSTPLDFFDAIGRQCKLKDNGFVSSFSNTASLDQIHAIADIFCAKSNGADSMTLRRMNLLKCNDDYLDGIENKNDKMIVLGGHAGTGKTIRLLKAAEKLSRLGKKCLLLTYNTALISDLKHTLKYISKQANPLLTIDSMYSFFIGIMRNNGIWKNGYSLNDYKSSMAILYNNRQRELTVPFSYDFCFVDEAQDWSKQEADLLIQFSNKAKIIIADGIDQFMKSGEHTDWGPYSFPKLKVNLRQRSNLVSFAKIFASKWGVFWDVEPSMNAPGGRVIITHSYEKKLHDRLYDQARKHGCTAYDIMLLAANSLVTSGHFDLIQAYKNEGINLFDGVNKTIRDSVYEEKNRINEECRVFTYESCRGLEAWTVVCLRFDQLFSMPHPHDYHLIDYSAARSYMLALWSLIPLSRAVDTLVLVVAKNSATDLVLRQIALENPDYIEYPHE